MENPYNDNETLKTTGAIQDLKMIEKLGKSANINSVNKAAYLFAKKAFSSKLQIDADKAFLYAEKASKRGSAESAILLSSFYLIGLGCEKSFQEYEIWITRVNKYISKLKLDNPKKAHELSSKRKTVIGATKNYMTVSWK